MFKIGDKVEVILSDNSIRIKNKYRGFISEIFDIDKDMRGNDIYRIRNIGVFFYEHELKFHKKTNKTKYVGGG